MQQGNESKIRNPKFAIRNFRRAFALYEVLIGVAIFAVGVIALGRAVENCLNASSISAEESAVRQILADRMAEIQAAPVLPDAEKEFKVNSSYGMVKLIQNTECWMELLGTVRCAVSRKHSGQRGVATIAASH